MSAVTTGSTAAHGHFGFTLAPGETGSAAVGIQNDQPVALQMQIYSADLIEGRDGTLSPTQPNPDLNGSGLWVHAEHPSLTLPGGASAIVTFTVTVPVGTAPGDHPAAIVVSANIGTEGHSVVQAREALIVEIHVPGTAHPAATLGRLTQSPPGATTGSMTFALPVTNSGDVTLTVTGHIQVTDSAGKPAGTVVLSPSSATVIPGGSFNLQSEIWPAPAKGQVTLQAVVELAVGGGTTTTMHSNTLTLGTPDPPPWGLIIAAVVLLLSLGGATATVLIRRRPRQPAPVIPGDGRERGPGGAFEP